MASAIGMLVGNDAHIREEPVLVNELASVVGRHDRDHPGITLRVPRLAVLGTTPERLPVDERRVSRSRSVVDVVSPDVHADLEVGHVERLLVKRPALGELLVDGDREVLGALELEAAEETPVTGGDFELHLLLAHD